MRPPGSPGTGFSQAPACAPGGTHRLEPAKTITRKVAGGGSGIGRSRVQVTALVGSQSAPPPRLETRRTCVPEVPLTSDAMMGGSSSSRSLGDPGLEDKPGLTTSSAPGRGPSGGAGCGLRLYAWPRAACGEAGVGSAQRARHGRRRPPLRPPRASLPSRTHHLLAARSVP